MSLVNRTEVKKQFLSRWENKRSHKMTRVSKEAIDWVESQVILAIDRLIETHPSLGKTIKPD